MDLPPYVAPLQMARKRNPPCRWSYPARATAHLWMQPLSGPFNDDDLLRSSRDGSLCQFLRTSQGALAHQFEACLGIEQRLTRYTNPVAVLTRPSGSVTSMALDRVAGHAW